MSSANLHELLDADELLHLALRSIESERFDDALGYLKQAIARAPEDGRLYYLLGVVHADLGLTERAAEEMAEALRLSPEAHEIRFHLGWIQFEGDDIEGALETWQGLDTLGAEHSLVLFRNGIQALLSDDYATCAALVRRAFEVAEDDMFEDEMASVLAFAEEELGEDSQQAPIEASEAVLADPAKAKGNAGQHTLLAGYRKRALSDEGGG